MVDFEIVRELAAAPGERRLAARDLRHGRPVALHAGAHAAVEAAVLAKLSHPAIPPLYATGELDGEPFLATRLVEDETAAGGLEPLIQAAEALAHAHAHGVSHGGLVAGDVRVGRFGETLVDGWGRAAPGADPRDDVLAWGRIARARLAAPPAELAAIVAKAGDPDAARRYPDARGLAEDLRRWVTGELVGAHRYSLPALARRWVRRHRLLAGSLAAAVVAVAVIGAVSLAGVVAETHRARAATATAEAARADALAHRDAAEDLAAFVLEDLRPPLKAIAKIPLLTRSAEAIERYLGSIAGSPYGVTARARTHMVRALDAHASAAGYGDGPAAAVALALMAADVGERARAAGSDPELDAATEMAHYIVAENLDRLGAPAAAQAALARSRALLEERLAAAPDDVRAARRLAEVRLGQDVTEANRRGDAGAGYRAQADRRDRLARLEPRAPDDHELAAALAAAELYTGLAALENERTEEGIATLERAGVRLRRLLDADPADVATALDLSGCEGALAGVLLAQGRALPARDLMAHVLEVRARLWLQDRGNGRLRRNLIYAAHQQMGTEAEVGDLAAVRALEHAYLDEDRRILAEHPEDVMAMKSVIDGQLALCQSLLRLHRPADAAAVCSAADADLDRIAKLAAGFARRRRVLADLMRARAELALGHADLAAAAAARALQAAPKFGSDDTVLTQIGQARLLAGRAALARGHIDEARGLLAAAVARFAETDLRRPADALAADDEIDARLAFARTLPPASRREQLRRALATADAIRARGAITPGRAPLLDEARRAAAGP